MIYIL